MRLPDATMRDLFALPVNRNSLVADAIFGCVVFCFTGNGHVAVWYAARSNTDELVIVTALRIVKGHGLGRTTAATACIDGGSGKGIFVTSGSDGCLLVYSVSFSIVCKLFILPRLCF